MTFPLDVCSGASCFFVALIVLLRCLSILNPLGFDTWHSRFTGIAVPGIWIYLIIIVLMPTMISLKMLTPESTKIYLPMYSMLWQVVYNATITLPVALIIILYFVKLYILKNNKNREGVQNQKKKSLETMIQMVTIGTLICFTPFIIWRHFFMLMVNEKHSQDTFNSTAKVIFLNTRNNLWWLRHTLFE